MDTQQLKDQIEKMERGLANAAIQGLAREALEKSLQKAREQLEAIVSEPGSQVVPETVEEAVAAIEAPEPAATGLGCNVTRNLRKNGVEIRFKNPVSAEVSAKLKSKGFNYSRFQNIWYNRYSQEVHQWAIDLCGDTEHSDNPAAVVLRGPADNANVRLITLASLTSRGKVPQGLLKDEIRAGKLEVAQYKTFNGMTDSTDYFPEKDLNWKPATMDDRGFDMDELRKNRANSHWSDSITLQDNGTIEYGSLRFRYKTSVEGHDYNPGEERSKIAAIEKAEKVELKKKAAQVLDLSPDKYHVPFNRPGKKGAFEIPKEERLNPQDYVGAQPFPATMEYDGYKVVGTLGTKNVVTSTMWTFGGKAEEKREDVWDFKPDDVKLSPYAVNLSRFRKRQPGDVSDFPGWRIEFSVRDVWDDMKSRVQNAKYEAAKMNERGKTERGKKIHEGKMKEAITRLNLFKKLWIAYEETNPDALRKVTGEGPAEQAYRMLLWKKDLSLAQPDDAKLQAARQAAEAELKGETVASEPQIALATQATPQKNVNYGSAAEVLVDREVVKRGDIVVLNQDVYSDTPDGAMVEVLWGVGENMKKIQVQKRSLNFDLNNLKYPKGQLLDKKILGPNPPSPNLFDPNQQKSHLGFKVGDTVRVIHLTDVSLGNGKRGESPYNGKIGTVVNSQPNDIDVFIEGLTGESGVGFLPNTLEKIPAPKFKKGDTALYKGKSVKLLSDGQYSPITGYYVYLAKAEGWDDPDNVGEPSLTKTVQPAQNKFGKFEPEQRVFNFKKKLYGTIKKKITAAAELMQSYSVILDDGSSQYWYEDELNPVTELKHRMLGRKIKILLPSGEEHTGQFAIVELGSITASHNERTFASSPGYPTNAQGRNANDRNYEGDKQAQALVQEYARDLKPELLISTSRTPEGTPIITPDGIVLSGNNRTMSLKLAASTYPDKITKYRDFLIEEMAAFGFSDQEAVEAMKIPVLVRIDNYIKDVATNELAKYNQATTKGVRPIDKSIALSARLSETLCGTNIPQIIGEFETLTDFYADRSAQKRVKDQLIGCGLMTQQEVPSFYGEGQFNEEGKTFIERTLGAAILSADALQAAEADGVKALRKAVVNALPVLLENKGLPSDGSLIAYVNEAIIFQQKMVSSKLSFGDYLGQKSIFDADSASHSRQAVVLNRLMNTGQRIFKTAVGKYNQTVKENDGASLFGDSDKVTPAQAFEGLIVSALPQSDQKVVERYFPKSDTPTQSNSEKITAAIDALRETLQYVEDTAVKTKIQAAIEALETTLAFV